MGFRFGFRLGIRVWDTGLGFRFYIQMGVSGLRFRLGINVWDSFLPDSGLGFVFGVHEPHTRIPNMNTKNKFGTCSSLDP